MKNVPAKNLQSGRYGQRIIPDKRREEAKRIALKEIDRKVDDHEDC